MSMLDTKNDDDLQSTIAFLCSSPQEPPNSDPEPIDVGVPVTHGPDGLVISSFPTCSQEEEASDESSAGTAHDHENLHLEVQRSDNADDASSASGASSTSGASSRDPRRVSADLYQRLKEAREQFCGLGLKREVHSPTKEQRTATSPVPILNNECQEKITNEETEQNENNVDENSSIRPNGGSSRRKSRKRYQRCNNNVAIQSILKILTPASDNKCDRTEERERNGSALPANAPTKVSDKQKAWSNGVSLRQGRFTLITSASINTYDPSSEYVPGVESSFPNLSSENFPPL